MAKADPLELHRQFVKKMITGVAFAIAGIAAGSAFSNIAPNAADSDSIAPVASLDDSVRTSTKIERNALHSVADPAPGFKSRLPIELQSER